MVDKSIGYHTAGLSAVMHELAPGLYQSRHRHGGEAWLYVISGRGHSVIDEVDHHVGGGRPDRRRPLGLAPALQRRPRSGPRALVRVHNFDALYDMIRILLDPLNLFEELPILDAPDLSGIVWPDHLDGRPGA